MTPFSSALDRLLGQLVALAEASPGREVCGFVVLPEGGRGAELWPAENAAEDPVRSFRIAPLEVLAALRRADRDGCRLLAVYHSHPSGGAGLSDKDLGELTVDGTPVLPGAELWVVALERGLAAEVRAFGWVGGSYAEVARRRRPFTVRERTGGSNPVGD